jgi:hypothetical protein
MRSNETKKLSAELQNYAQLNQELEKTAELQRLKIDRLTEENKQLTKQVQTERRLRYAVRNLVFGVDKAILAQIERLNQTPTRSLRAARYDALDYSHSEAERLQASIQKADLMAYYTRKRVPRPKKALVYKAVKQTYFLPRHIIAVSVKSALGMRKPKKDDS